MQKRTARHDSRFGELDRELWAVHLFMTSPSSALGSCTHLKIAGAEEFGTRTARLERRLIDHSAFGGRMFQSETARRHDREHMFSKLRVIDY